MARKAEGPAVLTANDLLTGAIVYRGESGWVDTLQAARRASSEAERAELEALGRAEETANVVVGAYLMTLDPASDAPVLLRERRRLAGPSFALPAAPNA